MGMYTGFQFIGRLKKEYKKTWWLKDDKSE